jgi:thioesterase domain-containing protein
VALLMATDLDPDGVPHDPFLPWWQSLVTRDLQSQYVDGQHLNLTEEPAVNAVASAIAFHLNCLQMEDPSPEAFAMAQLQGAL